MTSDDRGKHLHDQSTLSIPLSSAEQAELDAWYERLDQQERTLLAHGNGQRASAQLRSQLDAALAELQAVVQRILETEAENKSLKAHIAELEERLGLPKTMQPA